MRGTRSGSHGYAGLFTLILLLVSILAGTNLAAQSPILIGPTAVLGFAPSPDHNTTLAGQPILTSYQAEFFTATATQTGCPATPTGTAIVASLGKPAPDATNTIKSAPLVGLGIASNTMYCVYASAKGPGGTSARLGAASPFGSPAAPAAPTGLQVIP